MFLFQPNNLFTTKQNWYTQDFLNSIFHSKNSFEDEIILAYVPAQFSFWRMPKESINHFHAIDFETLSPSSRL